VSATRGELHISSTAESGTTRARAGATPVRPKTGQRFRVNLTAAISNQGKLYFTVHEGSLTDERHLRFLDRLATDHPTTRVHLIADQHPTHKSALRSCIIAVFRTQKRVRLCVIFCAYHHRYKHFRFFSNIS
jgi:hypothetical protein